MSICAFIGKQRNGKTLLMTKIAKIYQKKGYCIITNQKKIGFPHTYFNPDWLESKKGIEELKEKMKTNKLIFCLDEAHLWLDSRKSKNNTARTFFVSQAGKLMEEKGHFLFTTQYFGQIDIRLRYNTTFIFEVEKKIINKELYFQILTYEPRGERAFPIGKRLIKGEDLFEKDLYDRFEMIDIK